MTQIPYMVTSGWFLSCRGLCAWRKSGQKDGSSPWARLQLTHPSMRHGNGEKWRFKTKGRYTHTIHGTGKFYLHLPVNVGKYTSPMDAMG